MSTSPSPPLSATRMRLRVDIGKDPVSSRRLLVPVDCSSTVAELTRCVQKKRGSSFGLVPKRTPKAGSEALSTGALPIALKRKPGRCACPPPLAPLVSLFSSRARRFRTCFSFVPVFLAGGGRWDFGISLPTKKKMNWFAPSCWRKQKKKLALVVCAHAIKKETTAVRSAVRYPLACVFSDEVGDRANLHWERVSVVRVSLVCVRDPRTTKKSWFSLFFGGSTDSSTELSVAVLASCLCVTHHAELVTRRLYTPFGH